MTLSLRRSLLVVPVVGALLVAGLVAAPAQAAPSTSTGVRCTVVGTPGPDVLVGTRRRDVICGRGGADVIRARGGNDLVDAGAGRDRVLAGGGADQVLGAGGVDRIFAGPGADSVFGGQGADFVSGGAGADTLSGGSGADTLRGESGADSVSGGGQDDVIQGGSRGDDLTGGGGDDKLVSSGGADDVDGGLGDNRCIVDAQDEIIRCGYDEQPPVVVKTVVTPGEVDVTAAGAEVRVRVHASDDTGMRNVQVSLQNRDTGQGFSMGGLNLVSGTSRNGWWEDSVTIPRWTAPGPLTARVMVTDWHGRSTSDEGPAVQVADEDPDLQGPQVTLEQVTPGAVDVRTRSRSVTVRARATDPKSGVRRLEMCLQRPDSPDSQHPPLFVFVDCKEAARVSGTVRDGVWTAKLWVPKGSVGATYNVSVYAQDRTSNGVKWYGPEAYQQWLKGRRCCTVTHAFADDAGRVEVTGAVADVTPAWIDEVTVSKTELDTLAGADRTRVRVHALDATGQGEGVTSVDARLESGRWLSADPQFHRIRLVLTSGTVTDGWWEGTLEAPQGTPPGRYHVLVTVLDRAHGTTYTDPDGAAATNDQPLEGIPTITVVDSRS